jgi:hypothetical protein
VPDPNLFQLPTSIHVCDATGLVSVVDTKRHSVQLFGPMAVPAGVVDSERCAWSIVPPAQPSASDRLLSASNAASQFILQLRDGGRQGGGGSSSSGPQGQDEAVAGRDRGQGGAHSGPRLWPAH